MMFEDPRMDKDFQEFKRLQRGIEKAVLTAVKEAVLADPEVVKHGGRYDINQLMAMCTGVIEAAVSMASKAAKQVGLKEDEFVEQFVVGYAEVCLKAIRSKMGQSRH